MLCPIKMKIHFLSTLYWVDCWCAFRRFVLSLSTLSSQSLQYMQRMPPLLVVSEHINRVIRLAFVLCFHSFFCRPFVESHVYLIFIFSFSLFFVFLFFHLQEWILWSAFEYIAFKLYIRLLHLDNIDENVGLSGLLLQYRDKRWSRRTRKIQIELNGVNIFKQKLFKTRQQQQNSKITMHLPTILLLVFGCCGMVKSYQLGVGRADCTGPPVEIVFVSSDFFLFQS